MFRRRATALAIGILCVGLAVSESRAQTQIQTLSIPETGWHFLSLQVDPLDNDPLAVFPLVGGFEFDHLWSFDAVEGWRHFSPPAGLDQEIQSFNDLETIEPLRGYWMRVTRVPSADFSLAVEGDAVATQRLTGAAWHAIGPLLPPGAGPRNLQEVFADVGPALPLAITEAWGYNDAREEFAALAPATADCNLAPTACLEPGRGYWVLTSGDLALGHEFTVSPSEILLTAEAPLQKLVISYTGAGAATGALRPNIGGTSITFSPARFALIDGFPVAEPDPTGGSADGPSSEADLDGDGTLEACPDRCGGASDCVNLCFSDPSRSHTVYLSIAPEALFAMESFTSLDPGLELATLELDVGETEGVAGLTARAVESEVVARVPVAVSPPLLVGEWAGSLLYGSQADAPVPLRVWMDDCIQTPGGGPDSRDCTTSQLTAVINPTLMGSSANGLDDDGDGDVDEGDEDGVEIRTGEAPAFPGDVVLHGTSSGGNRLLRLEGTTSVGAALKQVMNVTCVADECADGSGVCSTDADCPRNAGLAIFFDESLRTLRLQGERTSPQTFSGTFVDIYDAVNLGSGESLSGTGRFTLRNISAPQCVVRDPASSRTLSLDVACRDDEDCPSRCTGGHSSLDGFSCVDDSDCVATVAGGQQVASTCQPFSCQFTALGGGSANALDHAPVVLSLTTQTPFGLATAELLGGDRIVVVRPEDQAAVNLGLLPCGERSIRISAANCEPLTVTIPDVCAPNLDPIELACSGSPVTATATAPGMSGGAFSVVGGVAVTGPASFQLDNPTQDCASCVARWEDPGGTPVPTVLVDTPGTIALFGLGAKDVAVGRKADGSYTDLVSWPPSDGTRSGLLHLLPALPSQAPGL